MAGKKLARRSNLKDSTATIGFEAKLAADLSSFRDLHSDFLSVLANGPAVAGYSNQSGDCNARSARREWATESQDLGSQRDIRRAHIEADFVDRVVALSGQIFYSTQIPVCLWFFEKNRDDGEALSA